MWQWLAECLLYLVNLITICGLSWHAFRQSERIKMLSDQVMESEIRHQKTLSSLAWERLSKDEKKIFEI